MRVLVYKNKRLEDNQEKKTSKFQISNLHFLGDVSARVHEA